MCACVFARETETYVSVTDKEMDCVCASVIGNTRVHEKAEWGYCVCVCVCERERERERER